MRNYFDYELELCFCRPFVLEIWTDVVNYEGIYHVSDLGRVKSLKRTKRSSSNGIQLVKEKILSQAKNREGYMKATFSKDGKYETMNVHRVMHISFVPNIENKPQVNHKNGQKDFNWLINTEWSTRSENITHADRIGLRNMPKKEKHHAFGINPDNHSRAKKVINTKTLEIFGSVKSLCDKIKVNVSIMRSKLNGTDKNNTDYMYLENYPLLE